MKNFLQICNLDRLKESEGFIINKQSSFIFSNPLNPTNNKLSCYIKGVGIDGIEYEKKREK